MKNISVKLVLLEELWNQSVYLNEKCEHDPVIFIIDNVLIFFSISLIYFGQQNIQKDVISYLNSFIDNRSHGVMVSTLDSESSDPSSNLGGT